MSYFLCIVLLSALGFRKYLSGSSLKSEQMFGLGELDNIFSWIKYIWVLHTSKNPMRLSMKSLLTDVHYDWMSVSLVRMSSIPKCEVSSIYYWKKVTENLTTRLNCFVPQKLGFFISWKWSVIQELRVRVACLLNIQSELYLSGLGNMITYTKLERY